MATGTGDFALELAGHASVSSVVGLDSTPEMLRVADAKSRAMERSARVSWLVGDAHHIPCRDAQFICATVGFGIRNFASVSDALREIVRVVKPGGKVVVLEIVRMEGRSLLSRLFPIYFRYATPWIGGLLAGDREAYAYLPASVEGVPHRITDSGADGGGGASQRYVPQAGPWLGWQFTWETDPIGTRPRPMRLVASPAGLG